MAIDTRNKRASVLNVFLPRRVYPNPDGSLANANDRTHMIMRYAGIAGAGSVTKKIPWHLFFRRTV